MYLFASWWLYLQFVFPNIVPTLQFLCLFLFFFPLYYQTQIFIWNGNAIPHRTISEISIKILMSCRNHSRFSKQSIVICPTVRLIAVSFFHFILIVILSSDLILIFSNVTDSLDSVPIDNIILLILCFFFSFFSRFLLWDTKAYANHCILFCSIPNHKYALMW